jgi:hypothetical protein
MGFWRHLFSPAARTTDAVAMFKRKGFTDEEASQAAREMWACARGGFPPPPWIRERIADLAAGGTGDKQ